ncbi:FAD-dependent thymidylate synthase [Pseudokineococcus basanitobsidens]|uniref:Flavin-dependent thymidylate synthase n=1 Tax=Pseudokineococcus basanitobsidens TaxID=1926649 RepID=A0ABU8RLP4_9ACTN
MSAGSGGPEQEVARQEAVQGATPGGTAEPGPPGSGAGGDAAPEPVFRSDVVVELVRASASDADVLFAARVSTKGEASRDDVGADLTADGDAQRRSAGLVNYLMRDRHGSPFEHTSMTFYVQAPIFVFREFMRHRIASYNEESGRYRELRPVFYVPGRDRRLVQEGKPGAYRFTAGTPDQHALVESEVRAASTRAYEAYRAMLDAGVAREVARVVLPVTTYSSMYVTMNARALMNFLSLRTQREGSTFPSFPQREIEMCAEVMEEVWRGLMPVTYAAFERNGRVAP